MGINRDQSIGFCGLDEDAAVRSVSALDPSANGDGADSITHARREYLAELYRLQSSTDEPVTTTSLANKLEVTPPAVVHMIRRLAREGYIKREPYKGMRLTPAGEREALRSIRRHRLLEAFMVTVMQFGWDEVHTHAHGLDAAINDEFEDRMDELSGYPKRCPHGDPIPTKDGHLPVVRDESLLHFSIGTQGVLRRIRNHTPEKLRYLAEIKLIPGTPITFVNRAPFNGPVRLKTPDGERVLGADMAADLYIEAETI